jgi:pyruvate dehydrogenase E1 component alpha subunit
VTVETGIATTELIQLLTPEGERVDHPDYPLDLTTDDIKALYRDLVLVRRIDTEAIALQRQGELGIWASLLGQEAAQIGSGRALNPQDMVFPTYREHGVAWCRGIDPVKLLELYRGVSHGGWAPEEHKFHLYTIVIGAQTLHATGYAMGIQRDGRETDEAVIVYFGDGATSQGDVNEAFVWAPVFNAPIVFFCQNNQWAISEPLEKQSRSPRVRLPRAAGRRQRRAGLLRGHQEGHAGGPRRPGAHADRGVHLPDGRAHHHRRPDQVPAGQRARGVEAQGPDRAGPGLPGQERASRA